MIDKYIIKFRYNLLTRFAKYIVLVAKKNKLIMNIIDFANNII